MIVGIDLDGTYGADVATFAALVDLFESAGHKCIIVTNRHENDLGYVRSVVGSTIPVVCCNGAPKRGATRQAGYEVHVWIDDNPILVDCGMQGYMAVPPGDRK